MKGLDSRSLLKTCRDRFRGNDSLQPQEDFSSDLLRGGVKEMDNPIVYPFQLGALILGAYLSWLIMRGKIRETRICKLY